MSAATIYNKDKRFAEKEVNSRDETLNLFIKTMRKLTDGELMQWYDCIYDSFWLKIAPAFIKKWHYNKVLKRKKASQERLNDIYDKAISHAA